MSIEGRFLIRREGFRLDADLTVPETGVTAIFGISGSGKTTLLRAIAGLESNPGGRLSIGSSVWQSEKEFLPPHQRGVGYVFQEASLFDHLSVRANLEYGYSRVPEPERRVDFFQTVELLGLSRLLDRSPAGLSGGERQRVAIGQALLSSPRLLLMDEPLASLDREGKLEILPFLSRLLSELEIPVFYVSHAADEVAQLADYLVLLEHGSVRADGPIVDMLTRLDLPLAHGEAAESLIEASVAGHDEQFALTYLDFPGGRLTVSLKELEVGQRVRLRILARDVSLTLREQSQTSILNIFPAVIHSLEPEGSSQMIVRLDVGQVPILSRLTRKSTTILGLEPGKRVYAQAKSIALLT